MDDYEKQILFSTAALISQGVHNKGCQCYYTCPCKCCGERNLNLETSIAWELRDIILKTPTGFNQVYVEYSTIERIIRRHTHHNNRLNELLKIIVYITQNSITPQLLFHAENWRDLRHQEMEERND